MNYIHHLRQLLALDCKQLNRFNKPGGKLVFIPTPENCFLGARLSLLPDSLNRNFMSDLSVQLMGNNSKQHYKSIIRLLQEDMFTKRLDFYSKEFDYSTNVTDDSLTVARIKEQITTHLLHNHWKEQPSEKNFILVFQYHELQMTVIIETLADVQLYPFWHQLHNFHIHKPAEDIPVLHRFVHFIIRKRTGL